MRAIFFTGCFFFFLSPLIATQIEWSKTPFSPSGTLNIYLNDQSAKKNINRQGESSWILLNLNKMMHKDAQFIVVIKKEGKNWLVKQKKIELIPFYEKFYLPQDSVWSIEIQTKDGKPLATVLFQ